MQRIREGIFASPTGTVDSESSFLLLRIFQDAERLTTKGERTWVGVLWLLNADLTLGDIDTSNAGGSA